MPLIPHPPTTPPQMENLAQECGVGEYPLHFLQVVLEAVL